MQSIIIDPAVMARMKAHALREYPHECCGAIIGTRRGDRTIVRISLELANSFDGSHRRRFAVAPFDYLRAEREADAHELTLLGFYHSHPDHPAQPSQTDREFAQPGFSYPILSVSNGAVTATASWRLPDGDSWYEEETVVEGTDEEEDDRPHDSSTITEHQHRGTA
jgi:proteasome lid subunit RPN8/RPN11